jgi:hypothetical protein
MTRAREHLADQLPAGGLAVLDQGDRAGERALVAGHQALRERLRAGGRCDAASGH